MTAVALVANERGEKGDSKCEDESELPGSQFSPVDCLDLVVVWGRSGCCRDSSTLNGL
ncbi:hypothetical protein [Streptomyces sp. NPDC086519]|uniref:hypothetical protein n=1 Tax=Streptomyces sp. NPDC086519 TaxID=3154863 RepID=UPI0034164BBD